MDSGKLEEFKEDFALLIEAGFVGVKQLDEISSTRIFLGAQCLSPDHSAPQIGLGYIALNKLQIKEATPIFEAITLKEPDNYLAQTFLAVCFLLTKGKGKKGEKLIQETLKKTNDPTIVNLATLTLEWAKKDLAKKSKAPFFNEQKESPDKKENA
jgi:hypothetical protein